MARRGDTGRARSVKGVFDEGFSATIRGGAVLIEKVVRAVGLRRILSSQLPQRDGDYSSANVCEQVVEGLMCGGRGFQAAEVLRKDTQLARVFGHTKVVDGKLETNVAEEATVGRALCQAAGLKLRKREDAYEPAGVRHARLDVFGYEQPQPKWRMLVPEQPEPMTDACRKQWLMATQQLALKCGRSLRTSVFSLMGFFAWHGDATDLEVRGNCFDAARKNHHGDMSLRLQTIAVGPIYMGAHLHKGATDEGDSLPLLIRESAWVIEELRGQRPVLSLLDAAHAEKQVVEELVGRNWYYAVCANQWREVLERLVKDLAESEWISQGVDQQRGWAESAVAVFRHHPEGWSQAQTVIVRRWREDGELPEIWHYSFLYTNLGREHLPKKQVKRYGYAQLIWMLYSSKQGRENVYKTWLSDLGGHHPASSRLGASQALSFLQAMAANLHAVIAYHVVPKEDRGIRLWRFVRDYVEIAGRVVMESGRKLVVHLAGADISPSAKQRWLAAYATAGQL